MLSKVVSAYSIINQDDLTTLTTNLQSYVSFFCFTIKSFTVPNNVLLVITTFRIIPAFRIYFNNNFEKWIWKATELSHTFIQAPCKICPDSFCSHALLWDNYAMMWEYVDLFCLKSISLEMDSCNWILFYHSF